MATSNIKALISGELQKVWELVLDIENYAAWRSDLSRRKLSAISNLLNTPKTATQRPLPRRLLSHTDDGNSIWKTAI